jgi:hypothetical protein
MLAAGAAFCSIYLYLLLLLNNTPSLLPAAGNQRITYQAKWAAAATNEVGSRFCTLEIQF